MLDCPSEDYLDSLVTNKQLLGLQEQSEQPLMMIHMAPASLITDPRYQAFMNRSVCSVNKMEILITSLSTKMIIAKERLVMLPIS